MAILALAIFAGSLLVLVVSSCNGNPEGAAPKAAEPEPLVVGQEDVVRARQGGIVAGPLISGELQPERSATVRAEIGGSVSEVHANEGERIARGAVLARIRAAAERQSAAAAETAVRTAETELEVARRDVERTERLVEGGALAQRDLEQARSAMAAAQARLAQAGASLATAREQLGNATVRSPMAGVVSDRPVNAGDVVAVGAPLFTIIDPATIELRAAVPADNMANIRVGTPVQFHVQGYPDRTFTGKIRRISPATDPNTNQVEIFVSIPSRDTTLIAGLYAEGRIAAGTKEAVIVPLRAIGLEGDSAYVIKIVDNKAVRQNVTLGIRDQHAGEAAVETGVQPGDVLLAGAAMNIPPGAPVRLTGEQAP